MENPNNSNYIDESFDPEEYMAAIEKTWTMRREGKTIDEIVKETGYNKDWVHYILYDY